MLAVTSALEAMKVDLATRALTEAKSDPFQHGIQVGMYRGIQASIDKVEELMKPKSAPQPERPEVYS